MMLVVTDALAALELLIIFIASANLFKFTQSCIVLHNLLTVTCWHL